MRLTNKQKQLTEFYENTQQHYSDSDNILTMEASRVFNELISKIEKSQLNYKISKTPFAANISIKSSFIRYFDAPTPHSEIKVPSEFDVLPNLDNTRLINNIKTVTEDKVNLEEVLNKEKLKVLSLEAEIGLFREEILKVKKEKKTLATNLKVSETNLLKMNEERVKMGKMIDDLDTQLKETNTKVKAEEVKCTNLNSDKIALGKQLDESLLELQSMKKDKLKEQNNRKEFKCCDAQFDSLVQLSQHVRENHTKNQVSQTIERNVEMEK